MPPKRKEATAEDEIEAPPAKITKGNKEGVDKGSSLKSVHLYTQEEYNRLLAQVAGHWKHWLISEKIYVSLQLLVQNRRRKWNFPLNFHTMCKLSGRYSGIFQNY